MSNKFVTLSVVISNEDCMTLVQMFVMNASLKNSKV